MARTSIGESEYELAPVYAAAAAELQGGASQRAVQRHEQQRVHGGMHVRYMQCYLEIHLKHTNIKLKESEVLLFSACKWS